MLAAGDSPLIPCDYTSSHAEAATAGNVEMGEYVLDAHLLTNWANQLSGIYCGEPSAPLRLAALSTGTQLPNSLTFWNFILTVYSLSGFGSIETNAQPLQSLT